MPDLSDLVPFHSGQVKNFNLLVLGQVQNLFKVRLKIKKKDCFSGHFFTKQMRQAGFFFFYFPKNR